MPARNRFTIYDVMDQNGVFERNPANSIARSADGQVLFQGPVQYPKMLYHPQGAEQILTPAEIIVTPLGPKAVGEQRELIWKIAHDAQEEADLRAEGWHTHPSGALRAAGKEAPSTGADQRIAELERQLKDMQEERTRLIGMRGPETAVTARAQGNVIPAGTPPPVQGPLSQGPLSKPPGASAVR